MKDLQIVKLGPNYLRLRYWDGKWWVYHTVRAEWKDLVLKADCEMALLKIKALFVGVQRRLTFPIFCIFPKFVCGFTFSRKVIQTYYYEGKMENPYVKCK